MTTESDRPHPTVFIPSLNVLRAAAEKEGGSEAKSAFDAVASALLREDTTEKPFIGNNGIDILRLRNRLSRTSAAGRKAALGIARSMAQHNPDNDNIKCTLANTLIHSGESNEAIPLLHTLIARSPDDGGLLFELANAFEKQGNIEAAQAAMLDATRAHIRTGNLDEAEDFIVILREQLKTNGKVFDELVARYDAARQRELETGRGFN